MTDVSILISVHNCLELTQACIESLYETMPSATVCKWELSIYDDQSTDGTADYLAALSAERENVRVFRESERGWFARNNNLLARQAKGRWLLFLNNDTICLPGWFDALFELAQKADAGESSAAVIGGLQIFPRMNAEIIGSERINHAGVVIDARGLPSHLYEGLSADLPAAHQTREMQAVTAACWLANAGLFNEIGGFFEGFRNGYEDIDFCLRVREIGRTVWYCGRSRIIHYGASTPARFDHESANQKLFLARSRGVAKDDLIATTQRDGVHWPAHSIIYRGVRALWTGPLVRPIVQFLLQFNLVIRLRNQVIRFLTPTPQTSKD